MATKYRIKVKGKSPQRKAVRFFSFVRKARPFPFNRPLAITTLTEGLTQEQIDLLKALEAKGQLPKITWILSKSNGFDDVMKCALLYLHSKEAKEMDCMMVRGYDYAWIKIALEYGPIPDRYTSYKYMSTPKFVDYIKSLGFTDIAGSKTLNKFIAKAKWHKDDKLLTFEDLSINAPERRRRNRIALKFLEILNEV